MIDTDSGKSLLQQLWEVKNGDLLAYIGQQEAAGKTITEIADAIGITRGTLYRWIGKAGGRREKTWVTS